MTRSTPPSVFLHFAFRAAIAVCRRASHQSAALNSQTRTAFFCASFKDRCCSSACGTSKWLQHPHFPLSASDANSPSSPLTLQAEPNPSVPYPWLPRLRNRRRLAPVGGLACSGATAWSKQKAPVGCLAGVPNENNYEALEAMCGRGTLADRYRSLR